MARALYSLLWYPGERTFEATRFAERALPARNATVLHRRHTPNLAMGAAYAEVGAELLPPHARPAAGDGVRLLWLPLLPSRCLLAARDATSGVIRVTDRPEAARDGVLSDLLIDLEVACAWAFDEAFHAREPSETRIAARVSEAHALAVDAIGRFAAHAAPPRLWTPEGGIA